MHPMFEIDMIFQQYRRIVSMYWSVETAFPVLAVSWRKFYCPGKEDEYYKVGGTYI